MIALEKQIKGQGSTAAEAARRFGAMQPRVPDLMCAKIDPFGLDTLVDMAAAGLDVEKTHRRGGVSERAVSAQREPKGAVVQTELCVPSSGAGL